MDFIPLTKREEILYQELMDTQVKLSQKNIEVKRLTRELNKKDKEKNFLFNLHDLNKKIVYESINHPLTN
tara:strand:+ start:899 stop:1108 length:210 start_codon:yes stop_codon:yes gene_type:complete